MVGTIVPVGNGQADIRRGCIVLMSYALGCLVGGLATGALLGLIAARVHEIWPGAMVSSLLAGFLFLIGSARELGILKFPVPETGWQVPKVWSYKLGKSAGAFLYGIVLGSGFFTRVTSLGFYAVILWILLATQPWWVPSLIMTGFAIGRVLPLLPMWQLGADPHDDIFEHLNRLDPFRLAFQVVNGMLLAGLGAFLVAATYHR